MPMGPPADPELLSCYARLAWGAQGEAGRGLGQESVPRLCVLQGLCGFAESFSPPPGKPKQAA